MLEAVGPSEQSRAVTQDATIATEDELLASYTALQPQMLSSRSKWSDYPGHQTFYVLENRGHWFPELLKWSGDAAHKYRKTNKLNVTP